MPLFNRKSRDAGQSLGRRTITQIEWLAEETARDMANDALGSKCQWAIRMRPDSEFAPDLNREQRLAAIAVEAFILDRFIRTSPWIPQPCANAFLGAFDRQIVRQFTALRYTLNDIIESYETLHPKWNALLDAAPMIDTPRRAGDALLSLSTAIASAISGIESPNILHVMSISAVLSSRGKMYREMFQGLQARDPTWNIAMQPRRA